MVGVPLSPPNLPEPLRLPRGSVRGLLAISVTATFGYLLLQRAAPVAPVILNSVIVLIAFYYGGGGRTVPAGLSGATPRAPTDKRRLGVQVMLLLGFAGLTGWFLRSNPSLAGIPPDLQGVWQVLGGYLIGVGLAWLVHRRAHVSGLRRILAVAFRDLSAAGTLALTAAICFAFATGQQSLLFGRAEEALSLVITYYFGSRVIH